MFAGVISSRTMSNTPSKWKNKYMVAFLTTFSCWANDQRSRYETDLIRRTQVYWFPLLGDSIFIVLGTKAILKKHVTFTQRWYDAGPPFTTLTQHHTNVSCCPDSAGSDLLTLKTPGHWPPFLAPKMLRVYARITSWHRCEPVKHGDRL